LQVEFVSRLANSLGVELVKAEALRAARERQSNPDAVDLSMRGWAEAFRPYSFQRRPDLQRPTRAHCRRLAQAGLPEGDKKTD
jgi:hypothetical protein